MKLKFNGFLVLLVVLVAQLTFAQERSVSGIVSDNAGMPLPGVSVLIKGTKIGTQSDFDGKYSIKAEPSAILVFSYVGMKTAEKSASSTTVNAKLSSDAMQLESVVVTSLGIKRDKKSLGYATQEVKGDDLKAGTSSGNFLNELSGKVAGVNITRNTNFGGSTSAISRGIKSLGQSNEMLIVIDGMPINNSNTSVDGTTSQSTGRQGFDYGNNAMDINPEDVESINVLKGAAASALYGYLAGNGVLMITTKKGKAKKGMGITVSSEFASGSADKDTFVKYQKEYGGGYGSSFSTADIAGDGTANDLVVAMGDDASAGDAFDPTLNVYQWDAFSAYPGNNNFGKATPWTAAKNDPNSFFQNSISLVNSISFEDANDKSNVVFNYSNSYQTGLLPNSELKKNNFSLKLNHQFTDKLSISTFANYSAQTTLGRNMTGYSDNMVTGFRQWWQTNVDIKQLEQAYNNSGGKNITWNRNSATDGAPAYWNNPYFERYQNYQNDSRNRFVGYANLTYKVNDWLSATGKISTDTYSEIREERVAVGSVGKTFGINGLNESSGYQRYNGNFSEQNYDLILNFKKNFGEDISLNGLVGGTIRRNKFNSILASTQDGLIIPGIYSLSNSKGTSPFPFERVTNNGVNSYFASVSLGYVDSFFLDATARRDAFSGLPEGKNTIPSYSASGSWIFSKQINAPWLSLGKLRGGYSESPLGTPSLALVDTYTKFDPINSQQMYSVNSIKNNPDLKPIKTVTYEAGLEMQFLDRRIGFDLSVYKNINDGEAVRVPYSTATGNSSRYINAATVENKGIEVQFNVTPIRTNDFSWDINVNWSKNNNMVTALAPGIENLQISSFPGTVTLNAVVGQPFGVLKGTDYTYAANGERIVNQTTGRYVINTSTNNIIGNINPDWIGGIRNKFNYKSISFSFLVDMKKGGDIFSTDQWYGVGTGLSESTAGLNDLGNPIRDPASAGGGVIFAGVTDATGTTPNTKRTDYFRPAAGAITNSYSGGARKGYVYDAGFIKLREINITYSLPSSIVSKMNLTDLKISLIGSNLWIIDKSLPEADPESGLGSNLGSQGLSIGSLPTARTIGCNLTIKF